MPPFEYLLEDLNTGQRAAVTHSDGPLLVLAGPGSGKTRVLTTRLAWLITQEGAAPSSLLALTFTRRAAQEMKGRLSALIGPAAQEVSISTFHAFGLRILRQWGSLLGYEPARLRILGTQTERAAILRQARQQSGRDGAPSREGRPDPAELPALLETIARTKRTCVSLAGSGETEQLLSRYQYLLQQANALDLEDLIRLPVHLLQEYPWLREFYQAIYRCILVDELQDTNAAEWALLTLLVNRAQQICVVGDPRQAIFAWRGSDARYLRLFPEFFPQAQVITLDQNYRSTGAIVELSAAIGRALPENSGRLWTANPPGLLPQAIEVSDEATEAETIAQELLRLRSSGEIVSWQDCAVLFRTNAQAPVLSRVLREAGIPTQVRAQATEAREAEEPGGEDEDSALPEAPAVTLLTMHGSKGLEWPVVFVTGLEEGLFPLVRADGGDDGDVSHAEQAERRLCYVASTRARQRLYLIHARHRARQGLLWFSPPSRFLTELPPGVLQSWTVNETGKWEQGHALS